LAKTGLGYILGYFFTSSSGHPVPNIILVTKNQTIFAPVKKLAKTIEFSGTKTPQVSLLGSFGFIFFLFGAGLPDGIFSNQK
jgi:hypothetical protein